MGSIKNYTLCLAALGFVLLTNEVKDISDFTKFSQGRKQYNLKHDDKFIHFPRNFIWSFLPQCLWFNFRKTKRN